MSATFCRLLIAVYTGLGVWGSWRMALGFTHDRRVGAIALGAVTMIVVWLVLELRRIEQKQRHHERERSP